MGECSAYSSLQTDS